MSGEPTQGPNGLRESLVAIDPKTGAVVAYYGGPSGTGHDYASDSYRPPGSSMKPYTLATGLEQGIGVEAIRNGSSPMSFPDRPGKPVHNAGSEACSACTLVQAITESLNTVFYGEAYDVGPEKVRQLALKAMDMPEVWPSGQLKGAKTLAQGGKTGGAIGIGQYELRVIDQAHGFATFAAGGIERDPFFVRQVRDSEGRVLLTNRGSAGQQVMPSDVAHDVTYALEGVAAWSHDALDGRPSAAKTGTQNLANSTIEDSDAWMVGYTPSLASAVWMGTDTVQAIRNSLGRPIYGAGLPGQIWKEFMDRTLAGTPAEQLPSSPIIQGDTGHPSHPTIAPPPPPPTTAAPTTTAPPTSQAPATTTSEATTTTPTDTGTPTTTTESAPTTTPPSKKKTAPGAPLPGGGSG
jgi:membrane peptidoglycan carboxypeptidase